MGQDAKRLVGLLREAVGHHVLVIDQATDAYVFRHALVQEAVYDDLLPVQRAAPRRLRQGATGVRTRGQATLPRSPTGCTSPAEPAAGYPPGAVPRCSATMPPSRSRQRTRSRPASRSQPASSAWAGQAPIERARYW